MKKVLCFFVSLFTPALLLAAAAVYEQPFRTQGTAGCVSISTTSWTAVPPTATASRYGMFVTNLSTNSARMGGHIGTTTTPTLSTTIVPINFIAGTTRYDAYSDATILYMLSLATSAETACYQEVFK